MPHKVGVYGAVPPLHRVLNAGPVNGTITSSGLYTAPTAVPSRGMSEIIATSVANPSAVGYGYGYVYDLGAGPTITSATPNPLYTGTPKGAVGHRARPHFLRREN